jgi:hypothetical protein
MDHELPRMRRARRQLQADLAAKSPKSFGQKQRIIPNDLHL